MARLPRDFEDAINQSEDVLGNLTDLFDRELFKFVQELEAYILALVTRVNGGLAVNGDQIIKDSANLQRAINARTEIIAYATANFGEFADDWIRQFDKVAAFTIENLNMSQIPAAFTDVDGAILDAIKERVRVRLGTGSDLVFQELTGDLIRETMIGGSFKNLIAKIKSRLLSAPLIGEAIPVGQSLEALVTRIGHDSLLETYRTVHQVKAEQAGAKKFLYHGQIVKNTRPFCRERKGKVFDLAVIKSWNNLSWAGRIPGTDVRITLGGYGCLDSLQAVPPQFEDAISKLDDLILAREAQARGQAA